MPAAASSFLCTVCCCDPHRTLFSQAAQNLIVLAREEAGAEKIFQSDGVRLLMQLLDTAKADLMLAALRTLVGLCSGHRSRVGATIAHGWAQGRAMLGRLQSVRQGSCQLLPARPELVRGIHPDKGLGNTKASPRPLEVTGALVPADHGHLVGTGGTPSCSSAGCGA